jgi:hypothetical protein
MDKRGFGALILIFLAVFTNRAAAIDVSQDTYGDFSDFLEDIYGIDNNAGSIAFPVLNVPLGGRSEGMAGAFTAVADDVSFLEWNPAGSSTLSKTEIAFFHNNWIGDTKIEGVAFASRYKDLGFAAGGKWLYTPFTEYNSRGKRISKGCYSEAVGILNASYNFLSGYYFSGISLGVNVKGAFRLISDFSGGNKTGQLISASQSTGMVMADVGLLTRFNFLKAYQSRDRNLAFALTARNLGPPVMGDPLPTVAVAGIAYKPLRPLLFAFDFSVPVNLADISPSEKPYWSLGTAVQITSFLSMRAGVLSKTGDFRVALGGAVDLDRIGLEVNCALDPLARSTPLNRVSLGVRLSLGDQGRQALADQVDTLYLLGLKAYAEGEIAEVQSRWEEALKLNPRFDPAKDGLALIRRTDELEARVDDMRRLNF